MFAIKGSVLDTRNLYVCIIIAIAMMISWVVVLGYLLADPEGTRC